ncbi:nuclear exosome regulator NRDE2 [Drosophila innubila]|uniref:nuclear exosome regulator NRDE2 n=1 Tax=Drosophila innubila TaxID=198719 RepID=UPI00148BD40E|nr:nuclear exosome regulator NRDE2 [Drosophila innubila]
MSLFPAYGDGGDNREPNVVDAPAQPIPATDNSTDKETNWKSNHSYELPAEIALPSFNTGAATEFDSDTESESSSRSASPARIPVVPVQRPLEFDNTVEFYVDKAPNKAQRELNTLPRLSRPQYKINQRRLADAKKTPRYRRYAKKSLRHFKLIVPSVDHTLSDEESTQIMQRIKKLKNLVAKEPKQLNNWIELHHLLSYNLSKTNRLAVAEHQLHMLGTALQELPGNEKLLQLYVATLSVTYPDSEVASQIEQLLERHPFEYTLWTALIMTTQGTMARCNVPDVLNIYEQCMRRMNLGQKDTDMLTDTNNDTDTDTDDLMLKLFHNCVLFLRQSANCDRMFALLKLALELNTQHLSFDCLVARAAVERPLVEYEELVLRSGMPMPEIWTRVERLRQAFNFLPYPELRGPIEEAANAGLDPQRFVYTEDVCRYIYPLKSKDNQLHLMLLAVQLTKLPFVRTNSLADRLSARIDQIGESEAVEMLLASLGDRHSYMLPLNSGDHYTEAMLQLAKELYVSPTFMPHFIGNELYEQCLSQLLLKCSEAFIDPNDESKRRVFIILWFRFERLRLLLLKLTGKLTDGYVKDARQRQRQLLSLEENRCVTRFYTELGMFEYEALDDEDKSSDLRIFDKIMNMPADVDDVDLLHANVIYAEMLFAREQYKQAQHILSSLVVQQSPKNSAPVELESAIRESSRHLCVALKTANEDAAMATHPMPLENYFIANKLMLLLRIHSLLLCMDGRSVEALEMLNNNLNLGIFAKVDIPETELKMKLEWTRCHFMREQLRELQLVIMQLPLLSLFSPRDGRKQLVSMLEQSLIEFPRNLAMLHRWTTLSSLPWYKLRGHLVHTRAGILALLHMVIAARCRFIHQIKSKTKKSSAIDELFSEELQQGYLENLVRNRVLSMFETFLPTNPYRSKEEADQYAILRRNSLYWRCYLRCLSNERTSFERSKSCLLMALDECPWDKALYMDGVTYVPQEVGNLQDVMTEKQLRIYAIPEELNVLREA